MMRVQGPDGVVDRRPGPYIEPVQLQVVCVRVWEHLAPGTTRVEEADVQTLRGHSAPVWTGAFSPDSSRVYHC
jgi:hypothetical protein